MLSTLSFTLLGLWWVVAERHREWFRQPVRRRMAGGAAGAFGVFLVSDTIRVVYARNARTKGSPRGGAA